MSTYEVEVKFRVADLQALQAELRARGAEPLDEVCQEDCYLAHPSRDFARTDEALRVRSVGDQAFLTYKGPRVDAATKTRQELELPLGEGATPWLALLQALGFTPAGTVRKRRRTLRLGHGEHRVLVALDDVEGLGSYVELELTAPEVGVAAARQALLDLAAQLGLQDGERRSYLELLQGSA
jgi:adenylate cyclase class 2